jgi:hypothetical protein
MSNTKKSLKGLSQSDINKIHFKAQEGDINAIQYYVNDKHILYLENLVETLKHKRNISTNSSNTEKYDKAIEYVKEGLFRLTKEGHRSKVESYRPPLPQGGKRQTKKRKHTKRRQTKKRQTRRR